MRFSKEVVSFLDKLDCDDSSAAHRAEVFLSLIAREPSRYMLRMRRGLFTTDSDTGEFSVHFNVDSNGLLVIAMFWRRPLPN
jgi:hypothetical protein